ncbi:hypothetical protein H9Q69_013117 [Fusarium xylarioides]|nr:hypothetical protein H9Q70_009325 [Fusarium xylarioides]KAG5776736.1 hypothetical protein H9Q73_009586 [Fusarium xylarioides]KAG5787817.1 hypothetical protein H9Q69_013117 [Fusarium xylarioides]KAG5823013.1 hypothetical protein H9Q74_006898 [Fusarium xylarioides]
METVRRRRRPAVSCNLCRKRKMRCNRGSPCSNCMRARKGECIYENPPPTERSTASQDHVAEIGGDFNAFLSLPTPEDLVASANSGLPGVSTAVASSSTGAPTPVSQSSIQELDILRNRVLQLESQLSSTTVTPLQSHVSTPASTLETSTSRLGGTFHLHSQRQHVGALATPRAISHKSRFFGQSHFVCGLPLLRDIIEAIDQYTTETSSLVIAVQKCKTMAKRIKALRAPAWPTPLTTELASKALCDSLVGCYLESIEKMYRILHIPTFRNKYDALWTSDVESDRDFVTQLKLVLALGATTYDDSFSLRASAVQWIYEVQTWISEPEFKSRLGVQFLQTNILLVLAREMVSVGGESSWIACGSLLRTAVSMGLHRDPALLSKTTTMACEMRRRLWNTILELCLQSSLSSGGPPMITEEEFDTEPPGNFDDDEIVVNGSTFRPNSVFTQTSTARALRLTFPTRLKVVKLLNDLKSGDSYQETLRLDAELKASYKEANRTLKDCKKSQNSPTEFELTVGDFITRRYLCALHFPYYGLSLQEPSYAFSRKMTIESAFRMWSTVSSDSATSPAKQQFSRLVTCSSGFFRLSAWQASIILVLELRSTVQEDDGFSLTPVRPDLLKVMEDSKSWNLRTIEAGETNIKGYLMLSILMAQILGLMRHLSETEIVEFIVKAGEEAMQDALAVFESFLAQLQPDGTEIQDLQEIDLNFMNDWDSLMVDDFLDDGVSDPMTWIF